MDPIFDYAADLHGLTALVAGRAETEEVVDSALHALAALIPHELAVVFRLDGGRLRAVAASGRLSGPSILAHTLELSAWPTLRRALELRVPIAVAEHQHAGPEGDLFDGVLDLPHGHACMVVPLFAGAESLGIISLDGATCGMYPPEHVRIAGVYGQLVSLALMLADQNALLDRYRHQLKEQNRLLVEEIGRDHACRRIEATRSARMADVARQARQVASASLPVLIRGETGTGKEVLAHAIHGWSPRVGGPFVKLNCSAIPENLVESELFGHVKGAYTGANRERRGRFVTANGGTVLLDEIGDLPLDAQGKLLRVLQEGTFEPVGSDRTVRVDVRVLAATHVDLEKAVAEGRFRRDLYYRLAVFPLHLPPLRERPEDIVSIAEDALAFEAGRSRRGPWTLPAESRRAMEQAPWPGNLRQLLNALERATILHPSGAIPPESLGIGGQGEQAPPATPPPQVPGAASAPEPLVSFEENERRYLAAVLRHTNGKLYGAGGAAEIVGLLPTTLRSRLVKLGLR